MQQVYDLNLWGESMGYSEGSHESSFGEPYISL